METYPGNSEFVVFCDPVDDFGSLLACEAESLDRPFKIFVQIENLVYQI